VVVGRMQDWRAAGIGVFGSPLIDIAKTFRRHHNDSVPGELCPPVITPVAMTNHFVPCVIRLCL